VVGTVLLLRSNRPLPNALLFAAGFMVVYVVVSVTAVVAGASTGSGPGSSDVRYWVSAVSGAVFLLGALVRLSRSRRTSGPPKWVAELRSCTPRLAFAAGLVLALVNPNLLILLSGLSAIGAADAGTAASLVGVLLLLVACLLDFAIPLGAFVLLGSRARGALDGLERWLVRHDTALSVGVLVVFGAGFLARGVAGLVG
jgi:hypothetical protein